MQIMKKSSTETSSRPTLMPDRIGTTIASIGYSRSAENAARSFTAPFVLADAINRAKSTDSEAVVKALRDVRFKGVAEIFMHPTPRGIPILPTAGEVTAAVNKSRAYLDKCILETA